MATPKKSSSVKAKKTNVKVRDLKPTKDSKGGAALSIQPISPAKFSKLN